LKKKGKQKNETAREKRRKKEGENEERG